MRDEFEVVRDIMQRRELRQRPHLRQTAARPERPSRFREIDGQELARQYVAHLQIEAATSLPPLRRGDGARAPECGTGSPGQKGLAGRMLLLMSRLRGKTL